MRLPLFSVLLACLSSTKADVTIYGVFGKTTTVPVQSGTDIPTTTTSYLTTHGPARFTSLAAYNDVYLPPPPIPSPAPDTAFTVNIPNSASNVVGLSIPQAGTFFGFSIEMSVATQLIGTNSSRLFVPFLNLMALVVERAGAVHVRVGGNTQETASMVDSFPDGRILEKDKEDASNPTSTPVLDYTIDLLYMLGNVSSLVNVKWYLGIPFNDTSHLRLEIAEHGEEILGDNLIGFQAGNEPDLYGAFSHGHRNASYGPWDYFGEFSQLTQAYASDTKITRKKSLIAPSTQGGNWPDPLNPANKPMGAEAVWNTGFVQVYDEYLSALAVEHYPNENCADIFPGDSEPLDLLIQLGPYLTHNNGLGQVQPHLNSTMLAQTWGKPFLMFETNTASCGGFPGISDAFTSALWAVDYALQMANSNFTGALFHAGGQNVTYNPFTAAPTNESSFHQWTVGPIFYAALAVAEALGSTNTSRVKDLFPNNGNEFTPAYAIYENDQLARMMLVNFLDDPSGAHDYTAAISVGGQQFGEGNAVPAQVKVKYLLAPSVAEKQNITWAGQTLGGRFQVDGRLKGTEDVQTVQCDQTANTCQIKVPAPGAALVFISDTAQQQAAAPDSASTYATTVVTKTKNTATVDPAVIATSNGQNGKNRGIGGTSQGGENGAVGVRALAATSALVAALTAVLVVGLSASLSAGLLW
ncbi:Beta-glucuronidase [Trametes pubescens]|uniref:Beta-glucuronidase n=1 Tax=Trametes pubescens TaxID=154538 RepID=A0A1M2VTH1_TRAPU|nr:Beta-glucuronidase [Trametes pubescens]